jgi:hypothetical protein
MRRKAFMARLSGASEQLDQLDWRNEAAVYRRTNNKSKYAMRIQVQVIAL